MATMSREGVASFMRHLFDDKKLAPKTIQSYKVGFTRPLRAWGINTSDEIFTDLIRAFGNLRPAEPYRPITWSLDKVLIMLSEVEYSSAGNLEWILSKALFLLSLATGGRISEIHALRREPEFLAFGDNDLTLISRVSFLAKNENPTHRRDPIVIPRLFDDDGSPHVLCPVAALENYIKSTNSVKTGPLFLSVKNNKPLSKAACAFHLCAVIKESQPGVFPKAHDVRKMATSLTFFANMSLTEICQRVGWASPMVFRKHYLRQIDMVIKNCVVLGKSLPM